MEENENISSYENPDMVIDDQSKSYLGISAKWAKVISIIMFISIAIIILFGIGLLFTGISPFSSDEFNGLGNETEGGITSGFKTYILGFLSIVYIAIGLLMFYPTLKLYHFSEKTQLALRRNDSEMLKLALENHKSYFKFTGIMLLVMIGIYVLFFVIFILATVTKLT